MDRAEAAGLGLSLAGHAALIALLSLGLLVIVRPPVVPSPAIDVDIVADTVGLTSQTPTPAPAPPAPRIAPETGPPEKAAPPEPAPVMIRPVSNPEPAPKAQPALRPALPPVAKPKPAVQPSPARPAAVPAPDDSRPRRRPGLDRGVLAGLVDKPGAPTSRPSASPGVAPSAPVGPAQIASLGAAILRQVQPCANRIVSPGPGAERIKTKINLQLNQDGTFAMAPRVIGQTTDADNARYGPRVGELARAAFVQCAPFELPVALYDGWKNINLNYKLPE